MATAPEIISEYEAAALVAMSPDLLRWMTSYAPKTGVKTKLKIARKEDDRIFYNRDEILSFDAFLRQPWPAKTGKRPNIPTKIRDEIRVEANGECAMCCQHGNKCEAAHLVPVATTQSNHPENLLWLCANHHTSYDKGHYGPKLGDEEFVAYQKKLLRRFRVAQWQMQAELSVKLIGALETCALLSSQLERAPTAEQVAAVESVANRFLAGLPSMAPVSKTDSRHAEFEKLSFEIDQLSSSTIPVRTRLLRAADVRDEYAAAMGMVACPLCNATGSYDGGDCPVCEGDRQISKDDLEHLDLRQYATVSCPLCEGARVHNGDTCPACGGEGDMERRQAEWIDLRDYNQVECPICDGEKTFNGEECRACWGEGFLERRDADKIDRREYDIISCPLCCGSGKHEHEECPACRGERKMLRRDATEIDLRDYQLVDCPVCNGSRYVRGDDCPACGGAGRIDRRICERIEVRDYHLVDCPVCKNDINRRYDCRACHGEGQMERRFKDRLDLSDYR